MDQYTNGELAKVVNAFSICPNCQEQLLSEFPSLSRKNNKTPICSTCEAQEVFDEYYQ